MRVPSIIRGVRAGALASALVAVALLAAPAWGLSARALPEIPPLEPAAVELGSDPYAEHADLYADEEVGFAEGQAGLAEPDPFEGMNRAVFGFNESLDRYMVEPAARAYGWVVPDPAKNAVHRVFANLNTPSILVNHVLQLEPKRAGITLTRFVVNSTVGVAGLFDVAGSLGMEACPTDFGQTLARAGLGTGPYMVMPIVGPSTARDAIGGAVDLALRPQTYLFFPAGMLILGGSNGIVTRESYLDELDELRSASVDYYATVRNVYFQRRAEQIRSLKDDADPPAGDDLAAASGEL